MITQQYSPSVSLPQAQGTPYPFTYQVIGAETVEVYEIDATGARTLVEPVNYIVLLAGNAPLYDQGSVTMTAALDPGTVQVSIERNTPITQLVDFQPYDRFPSDIVEFAFDKLTMICQELDYSKCDIKEEAP